MSILDGFYALGANVNKAKGRDDSEETADGVVSDFLPELTLDMKDDDLLALTEKWEKTWDESTVKANWLKQADDNENYWRGKQYNKLDTGINIRYVMGNKQGLFFYGEMKEPSGTYDPYTELEELMIRFPRPIS